jgi:hypothetical protein
MIRTLKRGILLRMRWPLLSMSAISNECDEAFEEFIVIEQNARDLQLSSGVSEFLEHPWSLRYSLRYFGLSSLHKHLLPLVLRAPGESGTLPGPLFLRASHHPLFLRVNAANLALISVLHRAFGVHRHAVRHRLLIPPTPAPNILVIQPCCLPAFDDRIWRKSV